MSTGVATRATPSFAARFPLFMRLALVSAWGVGILIAGRVALHLSTTGDLGADARAYWLTGQHATLYGAAPGTDGAFLYSPAFAQTVHVLTALPWPAFVTMWITLEAAALWWLIRPLPTRWAIPVALACLPELMVGNIYLLLAAVGVIALQHPAVWAFAALTKITPAVGVLWFAVRGEWRQVVVAAAATLAVSAASFVFDPAAWFAWGEFLFSHQSGAEDGRGGLLVRCGAAAALVMVGARTNHPWLIAPAMLLASPVNMNLPADAVLAALPRLILATPRRQRRAT